MRRGDITCLALDLVAEIYAIIPGRPNGCLGCAHRVGWPGGQHEPGAGENPIARLCRFIVRIVERLRDRVRCLDFIFRDDLSRVGECRWIRNSWSRADRRGVIARYIRDRDREKLCRACTLRETSAFDA